MGVAQRYIVPGAAQNQHNIMRKVITLLIYIDKANTTQKDQEAFDDL